jgi:hypothetical protein
VSQDCPGVQLSARACAAWICFVSAAVRICVLSYVVPEDKIDFFHGLKFRNFDKETVKKHSASWPAKNCICQ